MTPTPAHNENHTLLQRGFTFLELLIVILIISLLFGLGYANYRKFSNRKATEDVVRKIVGELRYTQQIANSVKKPEAGQCSDTEMYNYSLIVDAANLSYRVMGFCEGGSFEDKEGVLTKREIIIRKSHLNPIEFRVLGKGSNDGGTTLTIEEEDGTNSYTIEISATGEINSSL